MIASSNIARSTGTRVEDARFVTGTGHYTADLIEQGDFFACFVRSQVANGRLLSVDVDGARATDGVVDVITSSDIEQAGARPFKCVYKVDTVDGRPAFDPGRPALASDFVRFVGDPVALVVARTPKAAVDGAEAVFADIDELPPCTNLATATNDDSQQIWDGAPNNVSFEWQDGDKAATDAAFDRAAQIVSLELVNNRVAPSPLEPRGIRCQWRDGRCILQCATQGAHELRNFLADDVFSLPQDTFHVVTPDVGGSFGMKIMGYAEHVAMVVAAKKVGHPLVWMASRTEGFVSDNYARDHVTTAELALDANGRFLALRSDTLANLGAYIAQTGAMIPTLVQSTVFGGCYDFEAVSLRVRGVFTNQPSTDAYRGAGVPEALYLLERLVDVAAHELNLDRFELRRRNLVRRDQMPYQMAIGRRIDVGDFHATLDQALLSTDFANLETRRQEARKRGKLLGYGLSSHIHGTGGYPDHDTARIEVFPDGRVVLFCGAVQAGQGHQTTFRQILAEALDVDAERVDVRQGDSDELESSGGTGGSSSMTVAAQTVYRSINALVEAVRPTAADLLQAPTSDIGFATGRFHVLQGGGDVSFEAVAREIAQRRPTQPGRPSCVGAARFEGESRTFPNGTHVCEVEVDPETGRVDVVAYTAVDDIGTVVNPTLAEGQLHGAVAQGLGQALAEHVVYDHESGQLLSASLMDYELPRADIAPRRMTWISLPVPSTNNPHGMKGMGEIGCIAAPPAAINAICDALKVRHIDMPATPLKVFKHLR